MKIGVTGYTGRLGTFLLNAYPSRFVSLDVNVAPVDTTEETIKQKIADIKRHIELVQPDLVLHLAAKSGTDFCEDERNRDVVMRTNVNGTFNVACATEELGIPMVLLSSGYVFNGKRWFGKYKENERTEASNFYGLTKQAAESFASMFDHMGIIRTSYLYDFQRLYHLLHNDRFQDFPTFLKRSFMYLPHFAKSLTHYLANTSNMPFILHIAGSESCSWYDFMREVFYQSKFDTNKVLPRKQEEEGHAPRGYNLGLDTSLSERLGFPQYSIYDGVKAMLS